MSHNRLGLEKSPYLAQHKNNPVWWYPWAEEAFAAARTQGKPIFLSVGYATCHWCHVMERDSFEHQSVADVLNRDFISIKVDREERPDVDRLYMNVVQILTGHGGWPMSVLMTPDGQAFWGGTFVQRHRFIDLLTRVAELWKHDSAALTSDATRIFSHLEKMMALKPEVSDLPFLNPMMREETPSVLRNEATTETNTSPQAAPSQPAVFGQFAQMFLNRFDRFHGGYQGAPKFPNALALKTALRLHATQRNPELLEAITHTLKSMRRGGIFDQVGFGFHRYSVDEKWLVPHFEKMLYDNALLTQVYLEAYQATADFEFARVASEILEYAERDLLLECGGFASAEDADSEDIEGKFYLWSEDEIRKLLSPEEASSVLSTFHVEGPGNFSAHRTGEEEVLRHGEGKPIEPPAITGHIFYLEPEQTLPEAHAFAGAPLPQADLTASARQKLLAARAKRVRPLRDDKVLVSWNALMISAFAQASVVCRGLPTANSADQINSMLPARLVSDAKTSAESSSPNKSQVGSNENSKRYLAIATKAAQFLYDTLWNPEEAKLRRRFRDGEATHAGCADDYANLATAFLDLYTATLDEIWLVRALEIQTAMGSHFFDIQTGAFFDSDGADPQLKLRGHEFEDGVVPSANGTAAINLWRLAQYMMSEKLANQARTVLKAGWSLVERYPLAAGQLVSLAHQMSQPSTQELVIAGPTEHPESLMLRASLGQMFLPYLTLGAALDDHNPAMKTFKLLAGKQISSVSQQNESQSAPSFYLCTNRSCLAPATNAADVLKEL